MRTALAGASILFLVALSLAPPAHTQDPVSEISFDTIPAQVTLDGGGGLIGVEGDTLVSGSLAASGLITTGAGLRFPDATVQTTAARGCATTADQGLYSNTIAAISPSLAYSEVCFKSGGFQFDVHMGGESTEGGNCVPGDTGFVIEKTEREGGTFASWPEARTACLLDGMRLLEPFEWQFACDNAGPLELESMAGEEWEWASNTATPIVYEIFVETVPAFGNGPSCASLVRGQVANGNGGQDNFEVRCGR